MKLKFILLLILALLNGCTIKSDTVAMINDIPITYENLKDQIMMFKISYKINGLSEILEDGRLEEEAKNKLIEDHILVDIAKNKGIQISDDEIENNSSLLEDAIYSSFESTSELEAFLEEQGYTIERLSEYINQLAINRAYIRSLYQEVTRGISVTDSEIKNYYEENKEKYSYSSRSIKIIQLADEKSANEIYKDIEKGKIDFSDAYEGYTDNPNIINTVDLKNIYFKDLSEELAKVAFNIRKDEYSSVIEDGNFYYLIQCYEIKEGKEIPFEDVKDEVKSDLLAKKREEAYKVFIEEVQGEYEIHM